MEIVPFEGWHRCARLTSGSTEILVTLDVGPRVMRYGLIGGPNEFYVSEKHRGLTGGDEYRGYGGHRLWIAPEDWARTYQPDNDPIEFAEEGGASVFTAPTDKWGVQKQIRIRAVGVEGFSLEHRLINQGAYELDLGPWCLSQMAPGGVCIFPHAPFAAHTENFLPVRPLVLWGYTKMTDPRWVWGDRVVRFSHDSVRGPQKVGMAVEQGYAAYANHGNVFLKRFAFERGGDYPDLGCNFETFSNEDMLEVEALGPMCRVAPGAFVAFKEAWYLVPGVEPPAGDSECADWLDELASARPL